MSGGFSFPPPPPPPPKTAWSPPAGNDQYASQDRGRGRGQGRGRARPSEARGRDFGRGQSNPNLATLGQRPLEPRSGTFSQGDGANDVQSQTQSPWAELPPGSLVNPTFQPRAPHRAPAHPHVPSTSPPRTLAGHKRKLEALRPPVKSEWANSRTAPAVPSFGAPILPSKPLQAVPLKQSSISTAPRKTLGLAPSDHDPVYSSSDEEEVGEDVDEEALHAGLGEKLTFEHNGLVLSLKNAADLAAWQDERRKNWPTRTRMAEKEVEKRKVGQERKRLLNNVVVRQQDTAALQRQVQREAEKVRQASQKQELTLNQTPGILKAPTKPESRLEKARKDLAKQESRLAGLKKQVSRNQAALDGARARGAEGVVFKADPAKDSNVNVEQRNKTDEADDDSDISSILSESSVVSDDSSNSGSESDDDAPPEDTTIKPPTTTNERGTQQICKYFAASGHCRDGDACGFRHELAPGVQGVQPRQQQQQQQRSRQEDRPPKLDAKEGGRKSIYERLMEQQQEEEDRLALKVVKYLGKAGLFALQPEL
ncbi:hypothetical protein LTR62_005075 [Meristemomyces frigidus]|uniref:C3H1-type domain-containing protein n=1 Tax=Meristemomyces frigidus TaxID=1508187 RepID=A0AAN7TNB8_9PEZI|nr:hypothetical protein LTR62_005075 [Meristemomyces frigidus]